MKTMFLTFLMLALPMGSALGVPPPAVFAYAKSRSDAQLIVRIVRVVQYRLRDNVMYVRARAKVLRIEHARRRIRAGRQITIRYRYRLSRRNGFFGRAAMPRLREGATYRVYLNRARSGRYYAPAAGAQSFKQINHSRSRRVRIFR